MAKHYEIDDKGLEQLLEQCMRAGKGVCGIDEAGRGALAGPVVAAAVVFRGDPPAGLADSKKLTPKRRALLFDIIMSSASVGVGIIGPDVIDSVNILQANFMAMQHALEQLAGQSAIGAILVDGNYLTSGIQRDAEAMGAPIHAIVKGDAKVAAISAASIIAKVTRDRIMTDYDTKHPGYGLAGNSGYGSQLHMARLESHGPSPIHRMTFAPMATTLRREGGAA